MILEQNTCVYKLLRWEGKENKIEANYDLKRVKLFHNTMIMIRIE